MQGLAQGMHKFDPDLELQLALTASEQPRQWSGCCALNHQSSALQQVRMHWTSSSTGVTQTATLPDAGSGLSAPPPSTHSLHSTWMSCTSCSSTQCTSVWSIAFIPPGMRLGHKVPLQWAYARSDTWLTDNWSVIAGISQHLVS